MQATSIDDRNVTSVAIMIYKLFCYLLVTTVFVSCMSLPKPDQEEMKKIPSLMQNYSDTLSQGKADAAIEILDKAKLIITKKMDLAGGKGINFNDEARLTALAANIEFNRGNVELAAKKWAESFDIQYNGLKAKNEIDVLNAKIGDAIATGFSQSAAQSSAKSSGQKSYTYTVYNTPVPKPLMINMGLPVGSVLRIPVQVEAHPFDKIVKLNNNDKGSCTATMVSSRVAISAAHCMSAEGLAIDPTLISLKRSGIFPSQPLKVKEYFTHMGSNQGWDKNRKNDWLILITEKDYDISGTFPTIIPFIPNSILSGEEKVMLGGYSADLSKGFYLTLHHGCSFKVGQIPRAGIFFTNCENAKGSSGGAVMTIIPPYKVIAIHTAHLIDPKDDYFSVETFTPDFVKTLANVSLMYGGLSVLAENTSAQERDQGFLTVPPKGQEGGGTLTASPAHPNLKPTYPPP